LKWQSGPAYLRRIIGAPVLVALNTEKVGVIAPICMLADLAVCYAAMGGGATLRSSQVASFIVAVFLGYWFYVRPRVIGVTGPARRTLLFSLGVVSILALSLRSGVIEQLVQGWALPPHAAVLLAVIVSGLIMHLGYNLCISPPRWGVGTDAQWRALVIGIVGYAFLLRLVYSAQIELLPEETYYWNYSRHLDIGYLDHPPLVAWLIRAGTTLFGDNEFGVRFGALWCGVTASFFLFRLTRNLFGEANALLALVFAQVLPFFFLSGMLMTPDAPLTAAWAASLYFLERGLIAGRASAWIYAGLCLGIGLLSKYTIGLLGLAAFIFMVLDPPSRRWFRRWEPYAGVFVAATVFAPVIVWNAHHDWASFAFQTSRRLAERPRFSLHKLIGAAMVLITPTGLVAVGATFIGEKPQCTTATGTVTMVRAWRFMQLCLLVPLLVFFLFSLRHEIKLDWTGAPWVAALPVMAFGMSELQGRRAPRATQWLRAAWPATIVVMLLIFSTGAYYLVCGIPGAGYSEHTELIPVGWRDLGRQIDSVADDVRAKYGADSLVVGMDRYAIASELAFYSNDQSRSVAQTSTGHLFDEMGLMYEQWFPANLQSGRTLLLVAWDPDELTAVHLEKHVDGLEPIKEGVLLRNGNIVRRYYTRVAHGYRPSSQPQL
jgi:dolichol-phosphate mannosyltransferase